MAVCLRIVVVFALMLYFESNACARASFSLDGDVSFDSILCKSYGREAFLYKGPVICKTGLLRLDNPSVYQSTDFIDVSDYRFVEYLLPISIAAGITFYDVNKKVLDGVCSIEDEDVFIPIPIGAHYARFSLRTDTNRDFTITLYKSDIRARYKQFNVKYKQVFSHEEFGPNAIVRIPVHIITNNGTLLVACQVMDKNNAPTDINIFIARSVDRGKTWQKQMLCKGWNPNLTYDRQNDCIFAFNGKTYYKSTDDGQTWSKPIPLNIEGPKGWETFCQSPTTGIQLENGILATIYEAKRGRQKDISADVTFVVYSRDFGKTWESSPMTPIDVVTSETAIAEYASNQIMINARGGTEVAWNSSNPGRRVLISAKKTKNSREKWKIEKWKMHRSDCKLIEPICNASFISLKTGGKRIGLFCNPYTKKNPRRDMMLQYSKDFVTWYPLGLLTPQGKKVYGYCSLYYNVNHLSFVYEDIELGIMIADISDVFYDKNFS